jgi:hypothetical protein
MISIMKWVHEEVRENLDTVNKNVNAIQQNLL